MVWKKGEIPDSWKRAEVCFVQKEKASKQISQFRTILQGGNPGFSGCVEHTSVLRQMIQEAKALFNNSVAGLSERLWMNPTQSNNDTSQSARKSHSLREKVIKMVGEYFDGFQMRFSTDGSQKNGINWRKVLSLVVPYLQFCL